MAALMALFGGELSVGKSDVEKTPSSLSRRNSEQNGDGGDIDLSENIEDIPGGEERSTTMEGSSLKEFPSSSLISKAPSWSPVVAISAVFLISMAAFVILASLLIRRLDMASKKGSIVKTQQRLRILLGVDFGTQIFNPLSWPARHHESD